MLTVFQRTGGRLKNLTLQGKFSTLTREISLIFHKSDVYPQLARIHQEIRKEARPNINRQGATPSARLTLRSYTDLGATPNQWFHITQEKTSNLKELQIATPKSPNYNKLSSQNLVQKHKEFTSDLTHNARMADTKNLHSVSQLHNGLHRSRTQSLQILEILPKSLNASRKAYNLKNYTYKKHTAQKSALTGDLGPKIQRTRGDIFEIFQDFEFTILTI